MSENPLLQLQELGQSPWCDSVSRGLIAGDLGRWIRAGEITGVTSNPTIFEKAIDGSDEYDEDLRGLARAGKSASEVFDALAVQDIRATADRPRECLHQDSGHAAGHPGLRAGYRRGPQHQRHAAVLDRELRAGSPGVHEWAGEAPGGRQADRPRRLG